MSESLLSFSEVLLFGRPLDDIRIVVQDKAKAATTKNFADLKGKTVDNVKLKAGDKVLVKNQSTDTENGLYTVADNADSTWYNKAQFKKGTVIRVRKGKTQAGFWKQTGDFSANQQIFEETEKPRRRGSNNHLQKQLQDDDATLARIYGFAYEGTYYELPEPTVFLVHGEGKSATEKNLPTGQGARAPLDPSVTGVASADYQISNDILVWDYDKADFTLRMDVMTGQFEQVLLDIYFGFDSPAISGAKVSGAKISGAKVSGAKVSGAKVSGAKVSGAKARGSD